MKCINCGYEFDEGLFCPECGTKYEALLQNKLVQEKQLADLSEGKPEGKQDLQSQENVAKNDKNTSKKTVYMCGGVCLICGVVSLPLNCIMLGFLPAFLGVIFGIISFIRREGKIMPILGLIMSSISILISIGYLIVFISAGKASSDVEKAIKAGDQAKFAKAMNSFWISGSSEVDYYYEWYCSQEDYDSATDKVIEYCNKFYENRLFDVPDKYIDKISAINDKLSGDGKRKTEIFLESIEDAKVEEQVRIEKEEQERLSREVEEQVSLEAEKHEQINDLGTENALSARDTVDAYYAALVSADYEKAIAFCMKGNDNYNSINSLLEENLYDTCLSVLLEDNGNAQDAIDMTTAKKIAKNEYFLQLVKIVNETRFSGNYNVGDMISESDNSAEYLVNAERIIDQLDYISYMTGEGSNILNKYYYDNPKEFEKLADKGMEYLLLGVFESKYAEELVTCYRDSIYANAVYEDVQYKVSLTKSNGQWKIVSVDRIDNSETDDCDPELFPKTYDSYNQLDYIYYMTYAEWDDEQEVYLRMDYYEDCTEGTFWLEFNEYDETGDYQIPSGYGVFIMQDETKGIFYFDNDGGTIEFALHENSEYSSIDLFLEEGTLTMFDTQYAYSNVG